MQGYVEVQGLIRMAVMLYYVSGFQPSQCILHRAVILLLQTFAFISLWLHLKASSNCLLLLTASHICRLDTSLLSRTHFWALIFYFLLWMFLVPVCRNWQKNFERSRMTKMGNELMLTCSQLKTATASHGINCKAWSFIALIVWYLFAGAPKVPVATSSLWLPDSESPVQWFSNHRLLSVLQTFVLHLSLCFTCFPFCLVLLV